MKKQTILLAISISAFASQAQQDVQLSQCMFNPLAVNPAAAGIGKNMCVRTEYRNQWVGFEGSPKTILVNGDMWVPSVGGFGLTMVSDKLGFEKNFSAKLAYSFHIDIDDVGVIAAGIDAGIIQKSISGNWIAPTSVTGDNAIPSPSLRSSAWDAGAGVYFQSSQLYQGLSTTHVPETNVKQGTVNFKNQMHHYITAGYFHDLGPRLNLNPCLFVKSDASSTQVDASLIVLFNNRFWLGASYRLTDAVVALAGMKMGSAKIGYSFDLTTSDIRNYSSNTHELFISYCIKRLEHRSSHSNVLWLW